VESGTDAFVVEPVPQIAGALRKESGKLSGSVALRFGFDLLANVLKMPKLLFRDKILVEAASRATDD
jgi:hypothetical protein